METKSDDCILCEKIKQGRDVLYETDNFVVMIGFMIASAGHVMIVTKKHIPCLAMLDKSLYKEYLDLCNKTKKSVKEFFGESFFIDYGPGAQSINHTHTHFIPLKNKEYEINDLIKEAVIPTKMKFEKSDLYNLKKIYEAEGNYIWFGVNDSSYVYHIVGKYDSHKHFNWRYFLSQIKKAKSIPLHWNNTTQEQIKLDNFKVKETIEKLKAYFKIH